MPKALRAWDGTDFDETVQRVWAWDGAAFVPVNRIWGQNGTEFTHLWPDETDPGPTPLPPGTYILSPTSISLPSSKTGGFAEFDTTPYQGRITEVIARVSYNSWIATLNDVMVWRGRPSNTSYRSVTMIDSYRNTTIDHRMEVIAPVALTEFNNGSATGFNMSATFLNINTAISNVRLRLEIV